jgi:outer membrane receptor protein involved in Fe transport
MGFYLQDSWKLTPRFTLNPGMRYEFATMPQDIYGRD